MNTILIPQEISAAGQAFLRAQGYELRCGCGTSEATLCREVVGCDAILSRTAPISRAVLEAGTDLKVVGQHGVGMNNIDVDAATELGIWATNAPLSNAETVAEHNIGTMIALARHIIRHDRGLREGDFEIRNRVKGMDLSGKTLGILGLGRIGKFAARKAALGLGMKVIAYTRTPRPVDEWIERVDTPEELFRHADFVSLFLPGSPETRHSVGFRELGWMKPTAFLINSGRGEVVDEAALIETLQQGGIAGAGLDVFECEPPRPNHPLFSFDNVIVTPHSAALTFDALDRMALHAAQGIHAVLSGQAPQWPVNAPLCPRAI